MSQPSQSSLVYLGGYSLWVLFVLRMNFALMTIFKFNSSARSRHPLVLSVL